MPEDDVGRRPSGAPLAPPSTFGAGRCVALFELFRGGAGSVQLGRLHDGRDTPRLVALRRLANLPTRELESATSRAQRLSHPRMAQVLGTYQHEDIWYVASEYVPGVTLFELGQTAVRQRMPIAAPVAVRIVLEALVVTAETERLLGEGATARCLYPESLWIADSGELFLSEMLVAPVLARTTTGASYVAVTPGMSAPASDVRAAAVELARLACARLMNGNPASWQTRELPSELSELLARAIVGGPGCETPAAFAIGLSGLEPRLVASREAVQAEIERLMGPERRRRREQLEAHQQQTADVDTTRVFRVAPGVAIPDAANASITVRPPAASAAQRLASANAITARPPPKPQASARHGVHPAPTPPAPPPPALSAEIDSPISGVWREAHARMGVPGRRSRRKTNPDLEAMTRTPPPATVIPEPARAATDPKRIVLLLLLVCALGALLSATWLRRGSSSLRPSAAQRVP